MEEIKQTPGFEFLNLEGVCQAEKEILHSILRSNHSKEYSKGLFCFDTPFSEEEGGDPNVIQEYGQGEDNFSADPSADVIDAADISVSLQDQPVTVEVAEVSAQNGTIMALSPHPHAIVSQGGPQHPIPTFYPGQPHMSVSVSASGSSMGPNAVHNQASGNQMLMFTQPMQQMMQTPSGYSVPLGYPHSYYGPPQPQQGGQTHMSYVNTGEPLSPESNYIPTSGQQPHHKGGHHDQHHSMPHSPNTSGQGPPNNSYNKNRRKQQQHQQQQQQQYYYAGYAYGNVPYYNQQLAQNVTGSPIIMAATGLYSYPPHAHPSMYNQGPPPGNDMEHHTGNLGVPPQSMAPIPNEMAYAQHHPGQIYSHNSPTHSNPNPRMGYNPPPPSTRGTGAPPQSDQSSSATVTTVQSDVPFVERPNVTAGIDESATKSDKIDLSNGTQITQVSLKEEKGNPQPKEDKNSHKTVPLLSDNDNISEAPVVNGELITPSAEPVEINASQQPQQLSKDVTIVKSEAPLPLNSSISKDLKTAPHGKQVVVVSNENTKEMVNVKQVSVNGDIEDNTTSTNKSLKNRDKVSADPQSGPKRDQDKSNNTKTLDAKSRGVNLNNTTNSVPVRNINVSTTNPANASTKNSESKKPEQQEGTKEFPQLSTAPSENAKTAVTTSAKSRSWASIASVKTPHNPNDAAAARPILIQQHSNQLEDQQMVGGSFASYLNNSSSSNSTDQNVPTYYGDNKASSKTTSIEVEFDSARLTDENDPIALRLGEFLQKYNLDHQSIPLAPRGLCNQSNYCFLNATLQALLACPTFVNMFRAMSHILVRTPCKATPIIQSVFEFVNEFSPLIRGAANKKERIRDTFNVGPNLEPIGIRKCLGLLEGNTFKVEGRQEDAEEFLSHLLNGLHDEMIKVIKWSENKKERSLQPVVPLPVPLPSQPNVVNGGSQELTTEEEDDDQWQVMGAKNKSCLTRKTCITKSPISEAFLGQMCSSLRRVNAVTSATLQPFYTLQLDIQNENIRSVRDALESISTKEEVSGLTSATGSEVEAWRQLSLEELPPVLILHLKRFVYEKNGNRIHKIDKKLDFGVDLEIGKDLLSNTSKGRFTLKQRQYKLFAVVYHDGEEAHKGHYVADCFHTSGGSMWGQWGWLRHDDTAVKPVPEGNMLNPQPPRVPYLLYYRRQDTIQQQQQIKKDRS